MDLNFYTIFDLPQYKDEIIIENNYTFLNSHYQNKANIIPRKERLKYSGTIYFLGQPLYSSLPINYTQYLSYLQSIFSFYVQNKQNIIYIPHRGEEEKTFKDIKELYPQCIKVHKLSQPFELYLLENNIPINHLASFVSSALFTVKKLYPDVTIDAFKFPIKGKSEKNVLLIHTMLENIGANILKLSFDNTIVKKDLL